MKVLIKRGDWNNQVIRNKTFTMTRGLSIGQKGPFITVDATGHDTSYPQRNFRVGIANPEDMQLEDPNADIFADRAKRSFQGNLNPEIAKFVGAGDMLDQVVPAPLIETDETDQQIKDRIVERFSILQGLSMDIARGHIKGLVVSGASGVGKSFEVEAALNRDSLMDKLSFNADASDQDVRRMTRDKNFKPRYNIVKGYSTAPALYNTLFEYSESKEVLVFDDCDSVLGDEVSLNILKAALDTSGKRMIHWRSSSNRGSDAPSVFEFRGSVIFITNINFERIVEKGSSKLAPHLEAIMSRCLYLDLTIDTVREKLVRIDHVARGLQMLEREFKLDPIQADEVLDWTHTHAKKFRELSLRKVGQLASLRASNRNWERVAQVTLLKQR
jgi:hypothetical protein